MFISSKHFKMVVFLMLVTAKQGFNLSKCEFYKWAFAYIAILINVPVILTLEFIIIKKIYL